MKLTARITGPASLRAAAQARLDALLRARLLSQAQSRKPAMHEKSTDAQPPTNTVIPGLAPGTH